MMTFQADNAASFFSFSFFFRSSDFSFACQHATLTGSVWTLWWFIAHKLNFHIYVSHYDKCC